MVEDRRDYSDLKSYIRETLGVEISRLTRAFENQEKVLRDIEIKTTTRTAELQKDVNNLYEEIEATRKEIAGVQKALEQEESTRQFISNENRNLISGVKENSALRWEQQEKFNAGIREQISLINKLMWGAIMLLMGLMGTQAYQIIFGGK